MKKITCLVGILCALQVSLAQQKQDALDYIAKYKDLAIEEMLRCQIPASITLAQGIHESSCGKSPLCVQANNHFGIKCASAWDGKTYYQNDDAPNECFRVYDRPEDSYYDHSDFLGTRPRYSFLFQLPVTDYKSWAYGLKSAGYATNPKYTQILLNTIELYHLQQYDSIGLSMMQDNYQQIAPAASVQAPLASTESVKPGHSKQKVKEKEEPKQVSRDVSATNSPVREQYTVNGSWALKAQGKEDPLAVALAYNIDYDRLVAFNDLAEGEHFKDGEYIYLQTKKARGTQDSYRVQQGESMHDISQKFGIKLKELYAKNLMNPNDQVYPGETVYLQEKRNSPPRTKTYVEYLKSVSFSGSSTSTVHSVRPGSDKSVSAVTPVHSSVRVIEQPTRYKVERSDTLYSIAKKFNLRVEQLKALNNLHGSSLHPGQTLVISK